MRRQILIICLLVIIANFIFLSVGFSQGGVSINAVVPETDLNRNINSEVEKVNNVTTKQNKYLFFFQKGLEEQENGYEVQTVHDKISSYGIMFLLLLVSAILILLVVRSIDKYIINKKKKKK